MFSYLVFIWIKNFINSYNIFMFEFSYYFDFMQSIFVVFFVMKGKFFNGYGFVIVIVNCRKNNFVVIEFQWFEIYKLWIYQEVSSIIV